MKKRGNVVGGLWARSHAMIAQQRAGFQGHGTKGAPLALGERTWADVVQVAKVGSKAKNYKAATVGSKVVQFDTDPNFLLELLQVFKGA